MPLPKKNTSFQPAPSATPEITIETRIPGSNPNKDNAKHRKGNRPRTPNVPAGAKAPETEMSFKWIEPLPVVDPTPNELAPNLVTIPSGYIDLDPLLPSVIAKPFQDLFLAVSDRTNLPGTIATVASGKLLTLCYFKAAKQLFSTMTDPEKSQCQPLKPVFYDNTKIPTHMAAALSMIGHMDTQIGKIFVRHATLLFRQWIVAGLLSDPTINLNIAVTMSDFHRLFWRDSESKLWLNELCRAKLKLFHTETFVVQVGTQLVNVTVPMVPETQTGYNMINNAYPHEDEMKDLIAFLMQSEAQFKNLDPLPNGRDFNTLKTDLNVIEADPLINDANLRSYFEQSTANYITGVAVHVESLLIVKEPPAGDTGFAAQTVESSGSKAEFSLPMSDSDRHLGFMFNPCNGFEFNPRYVAYARRTTDMAKAEFAARDAKYVAM